MIPIPIATSKLKTFLEIADYMLGKGIDKVRDKARDKENTHAKPGSTHYVEENVKETLMFGSGVQTMPLLQVIWAVG